MRYDPREHMLEVHAIADNSVIAEATKAALKTIERIKADFFGTIEKKPKRDWPRYIRSLRK